MLIQPDQNEQRTKEQLQEHYRIEKELAARLRNSSAQERQTLYSEVYDELLQRVPHHPRISRKKSPQENAEKIRMQMRFLQRFLQSNTRFLEIGAGDCALSFEVAKHVDSVYAVEVSEEIATMTSCPSNFQLIISDGKTMPLPQGCIDLAYSYQLMEHLHPDDAVEQLCHIYRVLAPGGQYICITPNRLTGPWDISRYFEPVATGMHLKEYIHAELGALLKGIGFSRVYACFGMKGKYITPPLSVMTTFDVILKYFLGLFPYPQRKTIIQHLPVRLFFNLMVVGVK